MASLQVIHCGKIQFKKTKFTATQILSVYSIFEPAACFKPNCPKRARGGQDKPIARGDTHDPRPTTSTHNARPTTVSHTLQKIIPFEAVNSINGGTWTVQLQGGEIAFSLTDCVLP